MEEKNKDKKEKPFIATNDAETAEMLRRLGFQELPKQGDRWMFVNLTGGYVEFDSKDPKISYTNKLCFN